MLRKTTDEKPKYTEDFYFWTPPTQEDAPTGYGGPYFENLDTIHVQITMNQEGESANVGIKVHELFLERSATSLRNVMKLDDLDFSVRSSDTSTTYSEGTHYTLDYDSPKDYQMETHPSGHDNVSSVTWNVPANVADTVLVSYTAGVPDDWGSGGAATTYCLKSPGFLNWIRALMDSILCRHECV
jgi:hypothetical protein